MIKNNGLLIMDLETLILHLHGNVWLELFHNVIVKFCLSQPISINKSVKDCLNIQKSMHHVLKVIFNHVYKF